MANRIADIQAITGNILTLATADGWTRMVDTTSLPLTRDGATISTTDLQVGDTIRVSETRAADGAWSVRAIEALLDAARGTVASVSTDGFVLMAPDGSSITIRVSDATTWVTGCRQAGSLGALQVGAVTAVQGVRAADGSLDASRVLTFGMNLRRPDGRRGRPGQAPTPVSVASPEASPASI
jgi:hypothetical protein